MKYSYWDRDQLPLDTLIYGFKVDVNNVFTKVAVSSQLKRYVLQNHNQTYPAFHNVLKSGKAGSPSGSLYRYDFYLDEQEALDAFELKKQELRDQINLKIKSLNDLLTLVK